MKQCNLKEARIEDGRPAHQIAEALGLSRSQLYRIESGECQASTDIARRLRRFWPKKVPDLAIYDPKAFEEDRRKKESKSNE